MKQFISTLGFILFMGIISVSGQCCSGNNEKTDNQATCCDQSDSKATVEAYYFHATRRCATCQAVEKVSEEAIKEYYGDKVKFTSVNREKDENKDLTDKFNIHGQTLLIVKGDKVKNLTNYAFMNARSNPEKLKAKIKETIDVM